MVSNMWNIPIHNIKFLSIFVVGIPNLYEVGYKNIFFYRH